MRYRKITKKKRPGESLNTCDKNMIQVPKNNRFRKTRSSVRVEKPQKGSRAHRSKLGSGVTNKISYRNTNTGKKQMKRKLSPLLYKGQCPIITVYNYKPILICIKNVFVFVLFLSGVPVQHKGGFLPGIFLLTQCFYYRGTRSNAMKRFCICSL